MDERTRKLPEEPAPSAARWALVAIPSAMELLPVYAVPPECGEIGPGQLAEVPLRGRKTPGLVWELLDKPPVDPSKIRPLALPEGWPRLDPLWTEFLKWMSDYYMTSPSRMVDAAFPSWARRMFVSGNFGKRSKRVVEKLDAAPEREEPPELNAEQRRAVEAVLGSEGYAPFLLQGVTGSGKTRVYVELARKTLERGKNCLILVPEISLTKQTRDAFARQIGERVELFHSGLTEGTRKEIWRRVAEGSCRVLLGTRSASLLPMQNLGLVVVDEEHDSSYKQEDLTPLYNARDAMLWRARQLKIPIVLGSATPSLESRELAESGKMTRLVLERRVFDRPLPEVELVDMRESLRDFGAPLLSPRLREAIEETRAAGGQTILLHNRRGYSTWVCAKCGNAARCPDCDVALTYHRERKVLHCHHCERLISLKSPCAVCGGTEFAPAGFGIERLEEELRSWIPDLRTLRLDRDVTAKAGELERVLEAFRNGEADLLLGTQMVAKGHDFPRVQLVGIASADATLAVPDFRSGERMFQLLAQVAGRAGRGEKPGRVVIQTYVPDDPLMAFALKHDVEGAWRMLRESRRNFGYPPFARAAMVEFEGPDEAELRNAAMRFADAARASAGRSGIQVLGPAQAPVFRVRRKFRYRVLLKSPTSALLRGTILKARAACPERPGISVRVDIDPQTSA